MWNSNVYGLGVFYTCQVTLPDGTFYIIEQNNPDSYFLLTSKRLAPLERDYLEGLNKHCLEMVYRSCGEVGKVENLNIYKSIIVFGKSRTIRDLIKLSYLEWISN